MSMHMIKGVYVPKSKRKIKKLDVSKVEIEWRKYNKDMRRSNLHSCQFNTLDEYVLYITGKLKTKKKEFTSYVEPKSYSRQTKSYASITTENAIPSSEGTRRERPVYTGDYILGIATMHKSNAVPVGRGDDPKHYAQMRR